MPVHKGKDEKGYYYQWGEHGKRYYYDTKDNESREKARQKSLRQARAIFAHSYRGK